MNLRLVRVGIACVLAGFLLVFFLPVLPFTNAVNCNIPPGALYPSVCLNPSGAFYSGYQSIGHLLTRWGSVYSSWYADSQNFGGYVSPAVSYGLGIEVTFLSTLGFLLLFVFPAIVACVGLLAPEMVGFSRVSRIGFVAFGALTFIFSALLLASTLGQLVSSWPFLIVGVVLCPAGALMVSYGLRIWSLGPEYQDESDVLV